ncbi:sugar-binding domain-containing protein [Robiginitomaculum antarcticum]|uniref:sugar-binding domain-containing protein n=1 Tax=Robiginitomaculum antarcticum TaxID=437507 RepID=UPI00037B9687|nr:sugar-binding domain-containing protein [Robiginitomaculum antarcticum]
MKPYHTGLTLSLTTALLCLGLAGCGNSVSAEPAQSVIPSVAKDAPAWVTGGDKELKEIPLETIDGYTDGQRRLFNSGWLFAKGDQNVAEAINHPHERWWEAVTLPHDWAIKGPFSREHNARTGGLPTAGTGWYRKHFTLPQSALSKSVKIEFDGAMEHSSVWVNGEFVGYRPYGYIGFSYDVSEFLKAGDNVIAVKLEPKDLGSRWYAGAGLFRDVFIEIDAEAHLSPEDGYMRTDLTDPNNPVVNMSVVLNTELSSAEVEVEIKDANGKVVASKRADVSNENANNVLMQLEVPGAKLWSTETPYLYTVERRLIQNGNITDKFSSRLGFREFEFHKSDGFFLNGKRVEINGVCLHHDNGPLGAVANRRAIQRKLEIMKEMGVNAVRTSHNPPSPHLVDLADEMGILLQLEAFDVWKMPKNGTENSYGLAFENWYERDLTDMIKQFRGHASVFNWSIGNEVLEQSEVEIGMPLTQNMAKIIHELDPTLPVTAGLSKYPFPFDNGIADELDLIGVNYMPALYDELRARNENWPIVSTESSSVVSSRGVYHFPVEFYKKHPSLQVTSYDIVSPRNGYPPDWEFLGLDKHKDVMGEFVWTGFDYLGEPTPYSGRDHATGGYWNKDWPSRSSYFGIVDLVGLKKDRFYLYQSRWKKDAPMVHILPHWNWEGREGDTIPVMAYSNGEDVELFLNGNSLGRKTMGKDTVTLPLNNRHSPKIKQFESPYRLSWDVKYAPGTLSAVSYKDGKIHAKTEIKTAGPAFKMTLEADRSVIKADGQDLSYITVTITDKQGHIVPYAENMIRFKVKGAGKIAAVGNGDPTSEEPFITNYRRAFSGKAVAIIQSGDKPGKITLSAVSDRLETNEIVITTKN